MLARFLMPGFIVLFFLLAASPVQPVAAQPALIDCEVSDEGRDPDEHEWGLFDRINAYRAEQGLALLDRSPVLERAARWKAGSLAAGGPRMLQITDHDDASRTWDQRIIDCGYPASAGFGENLGVTNGSAEDLFAGWVLSPTHLANLVHPDWRYTGLARVDAGEGFAYWVAVFGTEP